MYKAIIFFAALFVTFDTVSSELTSKNKVVFVNPGYEANNPTGPFWQNVSNVMKQAAADLNLELSIKYANRDHILMKELVTEALLEKPDYLILVDEKSVITRALLANRPTSTQIHFLLNKPSSIDLDRLENKGYSISGSVVADNKKVGRNLMTELISLAGQQQGDILALLGDTSTPSSFEREKGLLSVLNRQHALKLRERVYANWSEQEAFSLVLGLAQRYQNLKIIWAANDAMAAGADRALKKLEIRDKVVIGGINWDPQSEQLDTSFGGHFLLGAYALVKLRDAIDGFETQTKHEEVDIFTPLSDKHKTLFRSLYSDGLSAINFREFSASADQKKELTVDVISQFYEKNF